MEWSEDAKHEMERDRFRYRCLNTWIPPKQNPGCFSYVKKTFPSPLFFCVCVSLFKLDFSPLSLKESWLIQGFILFPPAFCWFTLTIDIHSQELCQGRTVCACKQWRYLFVPPNRPRYMSRAWEAEILGREHKTLEKMSFFFFPWLCLQSSSPPNPCLFSEEKNFWICWVYFAGIQDVRRQKEVRGRETLQMLLDLICVLPFCPITRNQLASFFFNFLFDAELFLNKQTTKH